MQERGQVALTLRARENCFGHIFTNGALAEQNGFSSTNYATAVGRED